MMKLQATTKCAIAAVALATLLSACSGTTDPSPSPTPTSTAASTPAEQPTTEAPKPTPSEEATTPTVQPTAETTPAKTPTQPTLPTPPSTGPLTGAKLDAVGIKWFGTYCGGMNKVLNLPKPDTNGMTLEQAKQAVADAYGKLGGSLNAVSSDLDALDSKMNFKGSTEFAKFVVKGLADVGKVYTDAGSEFAAKTFKDEAAMKAFVQSIEKKAVDAGSSSGFGVPSLDTTIKQAVSTDVPECAKS